MASSTNYLGALPTSLGLEVLSGSHQGQRHFFLDTERVRIGRDSVEVVLDRELGVSRSHAELSLKNRAYVFSDLESRAGTYQLPAKVKVSSLQLELGSSTELLLGANGPTCRIQVGDTYPFTKGYLLVGALSVGGMAQVYLARRLGPRGMIYSESVIKVIRPEYSKIREFEDMFLDEARILSEIRHENVVQIDEVGEYQGVLFIAMDYLSGLPMSALLKQLQISTTPLPFDLVAALMAQVCAGLHAAHEVRGPNGQSRKIVHRDISPKNLMYMPNGQVKIIDFGIAYSEGQLYHCTQPGVFKGTPAHSSPEQLAASERIDRRSDVYATGIILHEMLTGQPLFLRETPEETMAAVRRREIPPLHALRPDVPAPLTEAVHRALAVDPVARQPTAAALGQELEEVVAQTEGGRFSQPAQIVRYFAAQGVRIQSSVPWPLCERPFFLRKEGAPVTPVMLPANDAPPRPASPPAESASAAPNELLLPIADAEQRWVEARPQLRVRVVSLNVHHARRPRLLPFDELGELEMPRLLVSAQPGPPSTLVLALEREPAGGPNRPAMYVNAQSPTTEMPTYLINAHVAGRHFDVGHRRTRVFRLAVDSQYNETRTEPSLRLYVPSLNLSIVAGEHPLRLTTLHLQPTASGLGHLLIIVSVG